MILVVLCKHIGCSVYCMNTLDDPCCVVQIPGMTLSVLCEYIGCSLYFYYIQYDPCVARIHRMTLVVLREYA